jgi:DNA mismatch repair protein MutS2
MNEHTLKVLEFHELINIIQGYAKSDPGRGRLAKLRPAGDSTKAFRMTPLFQSLVNLRNKNEELPEADFYSPESILLKLAPNGAVIDLLEVHVLARLMKVTDKVKRFLSRDTFKNDPPIKKMADGLSDFKSLLLAFSKLFNEKGDIREDASPLLEELNPLVHQLEKKINNKLNKILKSDSDGIFQDLIITRRNNRFVIPVKRESKSRIKGIVHDESASGRTLFIEPQSLINHIFHMFTIATKHG